MSAVLVVAVLAAAKTASGNASAGVAPSTPRTPPPQVSVLGVLQAGSGHYADGKLTLEGVQRTGVWFTDRPVRDVGTTNIGGFVKLFFRGDDPPNAAVEIAGADAAHDVAVVELSHPTYRARKHQLTFAAKVIPDVDHERLATHPSLAAYVERNDGALPKRFSTNSLFVDAASSHGTNVVNPVQQGLPAQDVEDLVNRLATDDLAIDQAQTSLRNLVQQYPKANCASTLFLKASDLYNDLLTSVTPMVQALQQDVADNDGGSLPQADVNDYNTAIAQIGAVEVGTESVVQLTAVCLNQQEHPPPS